MPYDLKVYELACAFLSDEPNVTEAERCELADDLQNTVETFLYWRDHKDPGPTELERNHATESRHGPFKCDDEIPF